MVPRCDWIAIGPHGVYALMDAQLSSQTEISKFRARAMVARHRTELVTVDEACRRHRDYLMQFDDMRAAFAALTTPVPASAQESGT